MYTINSFQMGFLSESTAFKVSRDYTQRISFFSSCSASRESVSVPTSYLTSTNFIFLSLSTSPANWSFSVFFSSTLLWMSYFSLLRRSNSFWREGWRSILAKVFRKSSTSFCFDLLRKWVTLEVVTMQHFACNFPSICAFPWQAFPLVRGQSSCFSW